MDLGGQPQEGRKEQNKGIDLWSSFRKLTYQVEGMGEKGFAGDMFAMLGPVFAMLWPALACSSPSMFLVLCKSTIALVIS